MHPPLYQGTRCIIVICLYFVSLGCELLESISWSINFMSPVPGTVSLMKDDLKLMPQVQTECFPMTETDKRTLQVRIYCLPGYFLTKIYCPRPYLGYHSDFGGNCTLSSNQTKYYKTKSPPSHINLPFYPQWFFFKWATEFELTVWPRLMVNVMGFVQK